VSRSRRHTPIRGFTTAKTDHPWKKTASRKLRRRTRQLLLADPHSFDLAGKRWDMVNPYSSEKDGKFWFGGDRADLTRK